MVLSCWAGHIFFSLECFSAALWWQTGLQVSVNMKNFPWRSKVTAFSSSRTSRNTFVPHIHRRCPVSVKHCSLGKFNCDLSCSSRLPGLQHGILLNSWWEHKLSSVSSSLKTSKQNIVLSLIETSAAPTVGTHNSPKKSLIPAKDTRQKLISRGLYRLPHRRPCFKTL